MPIWFYNDNSGDSLIAVYEELAEDENAYWARKGAALLQMVHFINVTFPTTQIWALTSHKRLCLVKDDSYPVWCVVIDAILDEYYFEYTMQSEKAPWQDATVQGKVDSFEGAKKYLAIAMRESGVWSGNEELEKLLKAVL